MSVDETNKEVIVVPTRSDLAEPAGPDDNFLETTDEQLRATSNSASTTPSQEEIVSWSETELDQTYDGPENAMFCANSANRIAAH